MYKFNAKDEKNKVVDWIRKYFVQNGQTSKAIIGISGGKDSSIVAALCVEALGKDRVIGVIMPNDIMEDYDIAVELCKTLDIKYYTIPISGAYNNIYNAVYSALKIEPNDIMTNNTPARLRMTTLYAVSAMLGGRVANTCNLSEDYVGYSTKFGDNVGDFAPLQSFTVREVKEIGRLLLPDKFIDKVPSDGLCGKTDEENFGFTYEDLDNFIINGSSGDANIDDKICVMHVNSLHKLIEIPRYNNHIKFNLNKYLDDLARGIIREKDEG